MYGYFAITVTFCIFQPKRQHSKGSLCDYPIDIDECSISIDNDCDQHSNCTNIDGSFLCTCDSGYTGDGAFCKGKKVLLVCTKLYIPKI